MTSLISDQNDKKFEIPKVQVDLEDKVKDLFDSGVSVVEPLAWKEYGLTIEVSSDKFKSVMSTLKEDQATSLDMLIDVTCVDWLDQKEKRFEVVYQLLSTSFLHRLCVKVFLEESKPEIESVRDLWASANFLEREVFDMFGVVFSGHGDLRRILMYDEFVGHPLRKDYPLQGKQPRIPLRIPELRNTSNDLHRSHLVGQQLVNLPTRNKKSNDVEKGL